MELACWKTELKIILTEQRICCILYIGIREELKSMNRTFIEVPIFTRKWKDEKKAFRAVIKILKEE